MHFVVALPTFNRAHTLARAIDSVLAQTYTDFELCVFDDGSTDGTAKLISDYSDPRISYTAFPVNRGAVAMDEWGLVHAVANGDAWTHLGSDDWWESHKLEADAAALSSADTNAVYGPVAVVDGGARTDYPDAHNGDPRSMILQQRTFACSWANIAVRSSVLAKVLDRHGSFCDARLRHVSDVVISSRIVRFANFKFRAGLDSAGIWVQGGATRSKAAAVAYETDLSWEIVQEETARWGLDAT